LQKEKTAQILRLHLNTIFSTAHFTLTDTKSNLSPSMSSLLSSSVPKTGKTDEVLLSVSETVSWGIIKSGHLCKLEDMNQAFECIKQLEGLLCEMKDMANQDKEAIRKDATSRLGEIVIKALSVDSSGASAMWRYWVSRDPTRILSNLLSK